MFFKKVLEMYWNWKIGGVALGLSFLLAIATSSWKTQF
jgi:Na+-transporting NADH:ubiquinone oxidoreductase subunit NqrB